MDSKKIGEFIKNRRIDANMTQIELANKLGVSNKTISKWETGKKMPSVELLEPLSRLLGISIPELLSGEKPAKSTDLIIKQLQKEKRKNITNLLIGIFICLLLCSLEVILYASNIEIKYANRILGIVIILILIIDIANYYRNKR